MAIDTTQKKLSLLTFGQDWLDTLPSGDGSFDSGDRYHFLGLYSGVAVTNVVVEPVFGALSLTGYAPSVAVTAANTVQPGFGALSLTGYAPVATVSDHKVASPATGLLTIGGYAPSALITTIGDHIVAPGLCEMALLGYAPIVVDSGVKTVSIACADLWLKGYPPNVINPRVAGSRTSKQLAGFRRPQPIAIDRPTQKQRIVM